MPPRDEISFYFVAKISQKPLLRGRKGIWNAAFFGARWRWGVWVGFAGG
jgi:hypothetical protein